MLHRLSILAALLLIALLPVTLASFDAHAAGVDPSQATEAQRKDATAAFMKGKAAFDAGKFEQALEGFRASYGVVASPNSHMMVVRSLEGLGRLAEAYDEAVLTAAEAARAAKADARYANAAEAARAKMNDLRGKIGILRVVTPPEAPATAVLAIGGRPVPAGKFRNRLAALPGKVEVTLEGYQPQTVEVKPGGSHTVRFTETAAAPLRDTPVGPSTTPDQPPPASGDAGLPSKRTMAYIAGGVGVAGVVVAAIFGGLALSTYNDLEDKCPSRSCPTAFASDADKGQSFQTVSNVGVVIGVVGLAAGAGLFTWDILSPDQEAGASAEAKVGAGSIELKARF